MAKDKGPTRKVCSGCAGELAVGGFRVSYPKGAQLHMDACFFCGKRLPVHDAWITSRRRRRAGMKKGG